MKVISIALAASALVFPSAAFAQQQDFSATVSETLEEPEQIPDVSSPARRARPQTAQIWYAGCDQVRLSGRAPLYRGQPGYRDDMDSDQDGIACEDYPGALEDARARQMQRMRRAAGGRLNR
jgi:hypothetical protein